MGNRFREQKMNIAVIGAGFYGCYIGNMIGAKHKVDIFEKASKPCAAAIINNQNRLHQGYHYPRCLKTIRQTVNTYKIFLDEFGSCVKFVDDNIYAVHKNSHVSFKEYIQTFNSFGLDHRVVPDKDKVWEKVKNSKDFQGAVRTSEGVIDCNKLTRNILEKIYKNKNVSLYCNETIDSHTILEFQKKYDYIINCTYKSPFLGMKPLVETKDEVCLIAVMKDTRFANLGFTIMDGPFCSLYPLDNDVYTMSSVLYTPVLGQTASSFCVKEQLEKIINHGKEYFDMSNSKLIDYYYGTKTKIKNDINDQRYSFVSKQDNIISVFSGKISSVIESCNEVLDAIK
jgi:hypothetical protein